MSNRSYADIQAAKKSLFGNEELDARNQDAAISSYPPGYITGFRLSIDTSGQLNAGAGAANVYGRGVTKDSSYLFTWQEWESARAASSYFYVYIDPDGAFHVSALPPAFAATYYSYYHPSNINWRNIGEIYLDADGDLVYSRTGDPGAGTGRRIVTVASSTYKGDYDAQCDGTYDQVELQRAIDYTADIGGGIVHLTQGTYYTTAALTMYANVVLQGMGAGTIIEKNADDYVIEAIGTSSVYVTSIGIRDLTVTQKSTDTNTNSMIHLRYVEDSIVANCYVRNHRSKAINVEFSRASHITQCLLDNADVSVATALSGIVISGSDITVSECNVANYTSTGASVVGIESASSLTAVRSLIINNHVKNLDGGSATVRSAGISLADDESTCRGNVVETVDDTFGCGIFVSGDKNTVESNRVTDASWRGIEVVNTATSASIQSNISYDNGTDFVDGGTGTIAWGNSWQGVANRVGSLLFMAEDLSASPPGGYLYCDGSAVSRTTYSVLFASIGETHGQGDSSTTFNIPDYRGLHLRVQDDGAGVDPDAGSRTAMATGGNTGDNVGSVQADEYKSHTHDVIGSNYDTSGGGAGTRIAGNSVGYGGGYAGAASARGGNETRGKNANIQVFIKY